MKANVFSKNEILNCDKFSKAQKDFLFAILPDGEMTVEQANKILFTFLKKEVI